MLDGVLAGRLVDPFDRPPRNAFLQVSQVRPDGQPGKPIGVEADKNGNFIIQGLDPGKTYAVRARTEDGDSIMAGEVQAKPPYTRLLIRLRSENAPAGGGGGASTDSSDERLPPEGLDLPDSDRDFSEDRDPLFGSGSSGGDRRAPPPSAVPPPPEPVPHSNALTPPEPALPTSPVLPAEASGSEDGIVQNTDPWFDDRGWEPGPPPPAVTGRGTVPPANPSTPRRELPERPSDFDPAPIVPSAPENIADRGGPRPTLLDVPGPGREPSDADFPPPPPEAPPGTRPNSATPTSSDRSPNTDAGRRTRINFKVYDPDGRPWEFRNHSGRLVLIDFWGTWCRPCLEALPTMKAITARHGAAGLEVVGIAIERAPTWKQAAERVRQVQRQYNLNYRVFLEGEHTQGELTERFQVESFPTLILYDAEGREIWRGMPSEHRQLEAILNQRLR